MTSRVLFVWRARMSEEYSVSSECSDAGTTWRLVPMMGAYSNLELAGLGDKMTRRLPSVAIGAISRTAIAAANCTAVMSAFPRSNTITRRRRGAFLTISSIIQASA